MGPQYKKTNPFSPSFRYVCISIFFIFYSIAVGSAETNKIQGKADLLFSGVWQPGESLEHKLNLIYTPKLAELSIRAFLSDARPCPSSNVPQEINPKVFGGMYHHPSNSRILAGPIIQKGLLQNMNSPSLGTVPYAEDHHRSSADLETTARTSTNIQHHITLATLKEKKFQAYTLLTIDSGTNWNVLGGWQNSGENESELRLEGFFLSQMLPERRSSAWFSDSPPLPQRTSSMVGFSGLLKSTMGTICAEGAWSQTQFMPLGFYGNSAVELDLDQWRIQLAADGTAGIFIGKNKKEAPRFFRSGIKIERTTARYGTIELACYSRSLSLSNYPDELGFLLDIKTKEFPSILQLNRVSISAKRTAEGAKATRRDLRESISTVIELGFYPIVLHLGADLYRLTPNDQGDRGIILFSGMDGQAIDAGTDLQCTATGQFGPIGIKTTLGLALQPERTILWNGLVQGIFKQDGYALNITCKSDELPHTWNISIAYQVRFGKKE